MIDEAELAEGEVPAAPLAATPPEPMWAAVLRKAEQHATLACGAVITIFALFRVYLMSGSTGTMFEILRSVGPTQVVLSVLASYISMIPWVAALLLMGPWNTPRVRWLAIVPALLFVLIAPLGALPVAAIATAIHLSLMGRSLLHAEEREERRRAAAAAKLLAVDEEYRSLSDAQREDEFIIKTFKQRALAEAETIRDQFQSRLRALTRLQVVTFAMVVAWIALLGVQTPVWLPTERVTMTDGSSQVAYVLSDDSGGFTTLALADGFQIVKVPVDEIESRQVCSRSKSRWAQTLFWMARDGVSPPRCSSL